MKKIPFFLTFKGWHTSGKEYQKAKILYEQGENFLSESLCLDIDYDSPILKDLDDYTIKLIDLKYKYKLISEYEKDKQLAEIKSKMWNPKEKELEFLNIEYKHNKIDELEYEKRKYDIDEKPWAVFNMKYDDNDDPNNMQVEVLYNEYFIKKLIKMGYSGDTEQGIINSWLSYMFASNIDDDLFLNNEPELKNNLVSKKKVNKKFIVG
jgi:hypothetical protein